MSTDGVCLQTYLMSIDVPRVRHIAKYRYVYRHNIGMSIDITYLMSIDVPRVRGYVYRHNIDGVCLQTYIMSIDVPIFCYMGWLRCQMIRL